MSSELARIQKIIADRGLASRREAEKWIEEGRVTVNHVTATLGMKADPRRDLIAIDENPIPRKSPERRLIAVNKPKGVVCTNRDPHAATTIFDLLPPEFRAEKLFCIGRLDKESEGLVLLTNDGELNQKLAHPAYQIRKRYKIRIDKPLSQNDAPRLIKGITWEGERLQVEKIIPLKSPVNQQQNVNLEVHMFHGKKREIRRLFYALGYDVKRLRRTHIGPVSVRGISRGSFKVLSKVEIERLQVVE